jgi:hypothetical protein
MRSSNVLSWLTLRGRLRADTARLAIQVAALRERVAGCAQGGTRANEILARSDSRAPGQLCEHAGQSRLRGIRTALGQGRGVHRRRQHGQRAGCDSRSAEGAADEECRRWSRPRLPSRDEPDRRREGRYRHEVQPRHLGIDQRRESASGHDHRQLLRSVRARRRAMEVQAPSNRRGTPSE